VANRSDLTDSHRGVFAECADLADWAPLAGEHSSATEGPALASFEPGVPPRPISMRRLVFHRNSPQRQAILADAKLSECQVGLGFGRRSQHRSKVMCRAPIMICVCALLGAGCKGGFGGGGGAVAAAGHGIAKGAVQATPMPPRAFLWASTFRVRRNRVRLRRAKTRFSTLDRKRRRL
jgi:hypothetical protein